MEDQDTIDRLYYERQSANEGRVIVFIVMFLPTFTYILIVGSVIAYAIYLFASQGIIVDFGGISGTLVLIMMPVCLFFLVISKLMITECTEKISEINGKINVLKNRDDRECSQ